MCWPFCLFLVPEKKADCFLKRNLQNDDGSWSRFKFSLSVWFGKNCLLKLLNNSNKNTIGKVKISFTYIWDFVGFKFSQHTMFFVGFINFQPASTNLGFYFRKYYWIQTSDILNKTFSRNQHTLWNLKIWDYNF
jgi:hypothetical protein